MTVSCADCERNGRPSFVAEKCPKCGEPAKRAKSPRYLWLCMNPACEVYFFGTGEGGVSHGLCLECYAKAMQGLGMADLPSGGLNSISQAIWPSNGH